MSTFFHEVENSNQFEGPEKKLEFVLNNPRPDLRNRPEGFWDRVTEACGAKVISKMSNAEMDAYLLSESSLFVWKDRILIITCGKTTLVNAAPEMLKIVDKDEVALLFYERKNHLYPCEQPSSFEDDVALLETCFSGKSRRMGPAGEDHIHVFHSSGGEIDPGCGVTFELLMHDIDPALFETFSADRSRTPDRAEKLSGISGIYPGMARDGFLFRPSGYSLNAISGRHYFTIHVTPQTEGSYASFETNVKEKNYDLVTRALIDIFRPGKFTMVITAGSDTPRPELRKAPDGDAFGYRMTEKREYMFDCGYAATFMNMVNAS